MKPGRSTCPIHGIALTCFSCLQVARGRGTSAAKARAARKNIRVRWARRKAAARPQEK